MKRIVAGATLIGVLVLCAVALAASLPNGTYTGTVNSSSLGGKLKGTWVLTFSSPNYTIAFGGSTVVKGTFTQRAGRVTFADKSGKLACPNKGVYSYNLNGSRLTFKPVSDSSAKCAGRRVVLAASFTKKFASKPGSYSPRR